MYKKIIILILLFAIFGKNGIAQYIKEPLFKIIQKVNIAETEIVDTTLQKAIVKYINSESNNDSTFKKYGYMSLTETMKEGKKKCFTLNKRYYYFYIDHIQRLPLMYTIVEDRLVLIYTYDYKAIQYVPSTKSAKKLIKKINATLPEYKEIVAEDEFTHERKKLLPVGETVLENSAIVICAE